MSNAPKKSATWSEANRLLGALASSVGSAKAARLGKEAVRGWDEADPEERAAIMEFEGGLSREDAERFAKLLAAASADPSPDGLAAIDVELIALDARWLEALARGRRR